MKLSELIKDISVESIKGSAEVEVTGLCHDSRTFKPGDLFIAVRGNQFDGHLFVSEALEKGASAVLVEDDRFTPLRNRGTVVMVKNTRETVASLSPKFFDFPSEKLYVCGMTGTNGKTTCTHMIESLLAESKPTGVIGTIDFHFQKHITASTHTTPDSVELQKLMHDWVGFGAKAVAMEVSSHALSLNRVQKIQFDSAVFTNLTRDHLDFHGTMENYEAAKAKLFHELLLESNKKSKLAIINIEDPHANAMMNRLLPIWTYGFHKADISVSQFKVSVEGSEFDIITPVGNGSFFLPMVGRHNISNALAAIGVALHTGMDLSAISTQLRKINSVKGRLERVISKNPVRVFIDYAHSDDALRNVLSFLKKLRTETKENYKIITVFGCGGDRDRGKRPMMMKAAEGLSDLVVVTSDNPRTENPEKIIDEILSGAKPTNIADGVIMVEPDRRKAIALAVEKADPGDVILIAGKGHEDYQIIGTKKVPFDDYKVAKEVLGT